MLSLSLEKLRFVLLSDFYSDLLTEKQREFLQLYYEEDLSLGEISEHFRVSRQAVYDSIRSSELCLERYEKDLGLLFEFQHLRHVLADVLEHLQELETNVVGVEEKTTIQYIKTRIHSLMNPSVPRRGSESRS